MIRACQEVVVMPFLLFLYHVRPSFGCHVSLVARWVGGDHVATIEIKMLRLCQRKYALDLLNIVGYLSNKPYSTPMDEKQVFNIVDNTPLKDPAAYRILVGKMLYLTITRPDLAFFHSNSNSIYE